MVIPARDEAATIVAVVRAVPSWVREVVVVDNGSRDETAARAAAAGARVLRAEEEGYGYACVTALRALRGDPVVAFIVGDGSDDPAELQRVTDPVRDGRADLVVGSRARGFVEPGAMHWAQRAGNLAVTSALSLRFAMRCTDLGPYRAMRRSALMGLGLRDMTWGWTLEMQIKAARAGLRICEVPVAWRRRQGGAPKVSGTLRGTLGAGRAMIRWLRGAYLGPSHDPR